MPSGGLGQPFEILDLLPDAADGLLAGCTRCHDDARLHVLRLAAFSRPDVLQGPAHVGIFGGRSDDAGDARDLRDLEAQLHRARGFQERNQADGAQRKVGARLRLGNHARGHVHVLRSPWLGDVDALHARLHHGQDVLQVVDVRGAVHPHPNALALSNQFGNLAGDERACGEPFRGGTLSSRSRISASALALAALPSMDSLLPGTKRKERTGFMGWPVTVCLLGSHCASNDRWGRGHRRAPEGASGRGGKRVGCTVPVPRRTHRTGERAAEVRRLRNGARALAVATAREGAGAPSQAARCAPEALGRIAGEPRTCSGI